MLLTSIGDISLYETRDQLIDNDIGWRKNKRTKQKPGQDRTRNNVKTNSQGTLE